MPVLQYSTHGGDGSALGRPRLPAAAGAPVGVVASEEAALFPSARCAYRHRRAEDLSARGRAGAARASPGFRTQGTTGGSELRSPVARPFPGAHPFGAVLRTSKFAPGEFVGSALNEHLHFHCCVIDGVFEPQQGGEEAVRFREAVLTDADVQWVQARVRQRVLRWFARRGHFEKDDAQEMAE